jgi:cell fate regulator YaaT (PSP1 superfamily)
MDNETNNNNNSDNNFLSRGCCHAPQIYQDNSKIANHRCCKLDVYDWLKDLEIPEGQKPFDCVEIRFKNSRKDFFRVPPEMKFIPGDIVAVEASPGHDIGIITLTGEIVKLQMRNKGVDPESENVKKVYRRARLSDIEKWLNAVDVEEQVKLRTRSIARSLGLEMKINDVEYQGDETKAVFYYTADERVDFRELIKLLADEFKVRVEMRQIGARQEAARVGGIGSCGRELCCATWLTDFTSVTTNTARTQQLSLNPQKLAGQCGKLKCCLNYENDIYLDALKDFPDSNIVLKTQKGEAIHQKSDVFKRLMWYTYKNDQSNMMALNVDRVNEIIEANKKNQLPQQLEDIAITKEIKTDMGNGGLTEEDISRFDKMDEAEESKRRKKKSRRKGTRQQPDDNKGQQSGRPQGQKQETRQRSNDRGNRGERPQRQNDGKQRNRPEGGRQRNNPENRKQRNNPNNRQNRRGGRDDSGGNRNRPDPKE